MLMFILSEVRMLTEPEDQKKILADLIGILNDMTSDWDLDFSGGINGDTRLVADLSFESVEIIQLMGAIEKHFQLKNFAAEELLMRDGRYVDDLSVSEIGEFLSKKG
jgi:acyl carrier protein